MPPCWKIQVNLLCRSKTCPKQVNNGLKYIRRKTHWAQERFDLDLWTCDLKINGDHLLIGRKPCTKFGIDQVKGSKDTERTTHWAEKSGLTLTFKHVILKLIGIFYSLRATLYQVWYWSREGVKRYSEDNTLGWEELFDLDLWTCELKINRGYLLIESNPVPSLVLIK